MKRTHQQFREFVAYGKEWEWLAYQMLRQRFPSLRPPLTVEQALAIPAGSVDTEPDMSLNGIPVECKRRRFEFTNAEDYPYETFYIDEEYKLRDKTIPQDAYNAMSTGEKRSYIRPFLCYLTANLSMTYMGVVIPASKTYWTLDKRPLTQDNRRGSSWACQLNKVIWCPVSEWRSILPWI